VKDKIIGILFMSLGVVLLSVSIMIVDNIVETRQKDIAWKIYGCIDSHYKDIRNVKSCIKQKVKETTGIDYKDTL